MLNYYNHDRGINTRLISHIYKPAGKLRLKKTFSFDMQKNTSEVQSICRSGTLLVKVNLQVGD
jgi:hypothetical protein